MFVSICEQAIFFQNERKIREKRRFYACMVACFSVSFAVINIVWVYNGWTFNFRYKFLHTQGILESYPNEDRHFRICEIHARTKGI